MMRDARSIGAIALTLVVVLAGCPDDESSPGVSSGDTQSAADLSADIVADTSVGEDSGALDSSFTEDSGSVDMGLLDTAGSMDISVTDSQVQDEPDTGATVDTFSEDVDAAEMPWLGVAVTVTDHEAVAVGAGVPVQFTDSAGNSVTELTDGSGVARFSEVDPFGSVTTIVVGEDGARDIVTMFVQRGDLPTLGPAPLPGPLDIRIPLCRGTSMEITYPVVYQVLVGDAGSVACETNEACTAGESGFCNVNTGMGLRVPGGETGVCYELVQDAPVVTATTCLHSGCPAVMKADLPTTTACVCNTCIENVGDEVLVGLWAYDGDGQPTDVLVESSAYTPDTPNITLDGWAQGVDVYRVDVDLAANGVGDFSGSAGLSLTSELGTVYLGLIEVQAFAGNAQLSEHSLIPAESPIDEVQLGLLLRYEPSEEVSGSVRIRRVGRPDADFSLDVGLDDADFAQLELVSLTSRNEGALEPLLTVTSDRSPSQADAALLSLRWHEPSEIACSLNSDSCPEGMTCNTLEGHCLETLEWHVVGPPFLIGAGETQIPLPSLTEVLASEYTYSENATEPEVSRFFIWEGDFIDGYSDFQSAIGFQDIVYPERYLEIVTSPRGVPFR